MQIHMQRILKINIPLKPELFLIGLKDRQLVKTNGKCKKTIICTKMEKYTNSHNGKVDQEDGRMWRNG